MERIPPPPYPGPPLDGQLPSAVQPVSMHQPCHLTSPCTSENGPHTYMQSPPTTGFSYQPTEPSGFSMGRVPAPPYPGPPLDGQAASAVEQPVYRHPPQHYSYHSTDQEVSCANFQSPPVTQKNIVEMPAKHSLTTEKTPAQPYAGPPLDNPSIGPSIPAQQASQAHQGLHYDKYAESLGSSKEISTGIATHTATVEKPSLDIVPPTVYPGQYIQSQQPIASGAAQPMYTYCTMTQPGVNVVQPGTTVVQPGTTVVQGGVKVVQPGASYVQPGTTVVQHRSQTGIVQQLGTPTIIQSTPQPTVVIQRAVQPGVTLIQPQVMPTVIQPAVQQGLTVYQTPATNTVYQTPATNTVYQTPATNTVVYRQLY